MMAEYAKAKGLCVATALADIQKAYEAVLHDWLIAEAQSYGFNLSPVTVLRAFPSLRDSMRVYVNDIAINVVHRAREASAIFHIPRRPLSLTWPG